MSHAAAVEKSPEAFRTISEVSAELDVPQHVLRFWETKFSAIKPLKRAGGRRYYRPEDVDLLRGIRALLYRDGLTVKGLQKILREQGARHVAAVGRGTASAGTETEDATVVSAARVRNGASQTVRVDEEPDEGLTEAERARFTMLLDELLDLKERLRAARRISAVSA